MSDREPPADVEVVYDLSELDVGDVLWFNDSASVTLSGRDTNGISVSRFAT